jgi:hypothetical protein
MPETEMTKDADTSQTLETILDRGNPLAKEFNKLRASAEAIRTWQSWSVYSDLNRISGARADADKKAEELYTDFLNQLSRTKIMLPAAMMSANAAVGLQVTNQLIELVTASQFAGRSILAMLRVQEASQSLAAVVERKYAYAFGFISLYAAIISIAFGAVGAYPMLR